MNRRGFFGALAAVMMVPAVILRLPDPPEVKSKPLNVLYTDDTIESIIIRRRAEAMARFGRQMEKSFWGAPV